MKSYLVCCAKDNVHKIRVVIHGNPRMYKKAVKKGGNDDPDSVACYMQLEYPNEMAVIGEMHFSKQNFSPGIVAHECFHAAYHRALLVGKDILTHEGEEFIAEGTQKLVETIVEEGKA